MADKAVRLSALIAPCFWPIHRELDFRRFEIARESGDARCNTAEGKREIWLKGGRGSTKSSFVSIEIILGLLRDKRSNAIIYRKVAATLRESVYEQMIWAIEQLGIGEYFKYRLAPLEIVYLPTGQRILFRGADDPGKSKSIKLSRGYFRYLWFEELSEFEGMDDVRTIKASVFRGELPGVRCITFYSYNPPRSRNNWVNEEALAARADRWVHHSTYRQIPDKWLGESFLQETAQLEAANERAWRHMYLGEVTGTGGQVFDNLVLREITDAEIAGFQAFYNGLDFGFAVDPDALIRVAYDSRLRKLLVLDEFCAVRTPTDDLAARVHAVAGAEVVHCDSAEPRMIQELRNRGLQVVGAKKGPGSVAHGMRWLQELSEIAIDPVRCPHAAREFSGYEYRTDDRGGFLADYPDRDNHLIDALRYALENITAMRAAKSFNRRNMGV